jgi:chemotaxis signal transduction protein
MNDKTPGGRHATLNNIREAEPLRDDALRERKPETTRKLQVLSVGSLVLGIFDDEIATIAEWRRPSPLPRAPAAVLGIVSIEGRILTVLDPLYLFDETITRLGFPAGLLVALRGDEQIALAIETRGETLDLAMKEIQPPSDPTNRAEAGIFHHGGHLVKVIEVKGLFQAALRGRERRRRRF